jgi:hypothetical protein
MKTSHFLLKIVLFAMLAVFCSYAGHSQDKDTTEKVLLVERNSLKAGQSKPTQQEFHCGKRIALSRYSNDTVLSGKIAAIKDSSVIVNEQSIPLTDIKTIKARRATAVIRTGAVTFSLSALLTLLGVSVAESSIHKSGNINPWLFVGSATAGVVALTVLIVGLIDRATATCYHMDRDFKISVKTLNSR